MKTYGFLFPFIFNNIEDYKSVPGREEFYGDDIKYVQPIIESQFEFLCFPLTRESPGVYDVKFCLPYFPDDTTDISAVFPHKVISTIFYDRLND